MVKAPNHFRRDIQGLRAIAVLAVIFFHYKSDWLPGGFVGVDVFLVISGYLMTGILLRQKENPRSGLADTLKHFYISRFKRIAPAYYCLLLIVSVIAAIFFTVNDYEFYSESLKSALVFNSSQHFAEFGDYFAPDVHEQPLLHTWSLAVEMQFYVYLPLMILLLKSNTLKWLMPTILVSLLLVAEWHLRIDQAGQSTYYALYARIPEFIFGGLVALFALGDRWSARLSNGLWLVGLTLVLGSTLLITGEMAFPGLLSLPPVIGAVIMIAAGRAQCASLISGRIAVWLGALSYSLYLWHWPVLALIRYFTGRQELNPSETVLFVVATLVSSCLSYYLVEQHFQRKGEQKGIPENRRAVMAAVLVAGIAWLSVQSMVWANLKLSPPPQPEEEKQYASQDEICHGSWVGECLKGDAASPREILVLGDSHGAMLNHFFDQLGKELGFSARVITASSCVTIPTYEWSMLAEWAEEPCRAQIERAREYVDKAGVIVIAGKWSSEKRGESLIENLNSFISDSNANIYLMSQVKQWESNPMRARRWHHLSIPVSISVNQSYKVANESVRQISSRHENAYYLDMEDLPVFGNRPLYNGELVYMDDHHLNELGAKIYAEQSQSVFNAVIAREWPEAQIGTVSDVDREAVQ
ncbi:lipopolysaccharide modification acyltransferase [gamma proteobacterium HTCC5015]|nr:lipopolysaccharide modification acyltransferase [gamma proteobacterium HTCC5015]